MGAGCSSPPLRAPFTVVVSFQENDDHSMLPAYRPGDRRTVYPYPYASLQPEMDVVKRTPSGLVLHRLRKSRVLASGEIVWITYGINNPATDLLRGNDDPAYMTEGGFMGVVTESDAPPALDHVGEIPIPPGDENRMSRVR